MKIFTLQVSLKELDSKDFPIPTIPKTLYCTNAVYLDNFEVAKNAFNYLVVNIGMPVVDTRKEL